MSTTQHHDAERETLSALFDGELRGDAACFALKRLDHDARWRDACGRWQLAGDALRGQAMAAAPAGFADRVGAALAGENTMAPTAVATGHARVAAHGTPSRRRWIGGVAIAASVAAAALFVTRPLPEPDAPIAPATQIATAPVTMPATGGNEALARQTPAPETPAQSATPRASSLPAAESGFAAAVATGPSRASARPPRDRVQPAAQPGIDDPMTAAMAPTAIADNTGAVPAGIEPSSTHPFLPQGEIVSRPWPRAALPNYPTGSAFTASFDSSSAAPGSSSFYPFEPRMLGAEMRQEPAPDPSGSPQR